MLQEAFDEGMQREEEVVLEGRFKEANHILHLNDVKSVKIRALNSNIEGGSVTRGEVISKRGLDPTRAHSFSILHSSPLVVKATRIPDLTDLTLAFAIRGSGTH